MNRTPGSMYSVGKDLYTSLSMVNVGAPNIDTFLGTVAISEANDKPKPPPKVSGWKVLSENGKAITRRT